MSVWKRGGKGGKGGWYITVTDQTAGQPIRKTFLSCTGDKGVAQDIETNVERMLSFRLAGDTPDPTLTKWLATMPGNLRRRMVKAGLLTGHHAAEGKRLAYHFIGYLHELRARGNDAKHIRLTVHKVGLIARECKAHHFSDLTAGKVKDYLARLVNESKLAPRTVNDYLTAVRGFLNWAVSTGRLGMNALASVQPMKTLDDETRGAFTVAEMRDLMDAATRGPVRYRMAGRERALLYRMAVETGYRASELRSLTRASFDLDSDSPTVRLLAAHSKGKRASKIPLRPDTAALLRAHLTPKTPAARAFMIPTSNHTAPMIHADMKAADIPIIDGENLRRDFHALRHSCGTWLAAANVPSRTIQSIMRHSTGALTARYTHADRHATAAALGRLPELKILQATGTDGRPADSAGAARSANCSAQGAERGYFGAASGAETAAGSPRGDEKKSPAGIGRNQHPRGIGSGRIRTSEGARPADLQSAPIDHSGTLPVQTVKV